MPITPAPHVKRPYVGDRLIRLADLGRETARVQANQALQRGDRSAQMWRDTGNAIASGIGAIRQERELVPLRQAAQLKMQREAEMLRRQDEAYTEGREAKSSNAALLADLNQFTESYGGQRPPAEDVVKRYGTKAAEINQVFDQMFPKADAKKTREVKTRNADGSESIQIVEDTPGQSFTSLPEPKAPKTYQVTVPGPDGRPITRTATEEEMSKGVPVYREPKAPPAEKAKFWVIRDGKQLRISEDEYRPGDLNANTREQGRAVTSGDAGRIADLDTSLDDLSVLGAALSESGSTGTMAKIGASVPNWVTEYTGWGSDPKKKQALIDRVKQVIGKALEGGVLRKEDEIKYEKILPTVGDPNNQVIAKIEGLNDAIKLRRTRTIDALRDAGYDTTNFGEYKPAASAAAPDLSGLPKGRGRKFTSGPFAGQTWALDEQGNPYKVGG